MVKSFFRGHVVVLVDSEWFYEDSMTPAGFNGEIRPCKKCGKVFEGSNIGKADPCLGELPGVDNACCGHGERSRSYIRFKNGAVLRFFEVKQKGE